MNKNTTISILLLAGILIMVNILASKFFFRLDLTEGKQFTLDQATKDILSELNDPVTVTAYFTKDLPPNLAKTKNDFRDLLVEYQRRSNGYVNYEIIDPADESTKQEAAQNGVQPFGIGIREKDQVKQQMVFMGAIIKLGENQEVIPAVLPNLPMEYTLSTSIKKLAIQDKPSLGIVNGHGEPALSDLGPIFQQLSVLFSVENLDLAAEQSIPDRFKAVAIIAPKDSFPPDQFGKLDDYLSRGGGLYVAINSVAGDLQNATGNPITTGLESWLSQKGITVESSFIIDAQCGQVTVQQQQGFFTINRAIQFPYLPLISTFADHPITNGLEQIILPFASPVSFNGDSTGTQIYTPIVFSSENAGVINAPTYFDINKEWTQTDFPLSNLSIGATLEGNIVGTTPAKLVVIGDGDFATAGGQQGQGGDNSSLMINAIEWLADDTGLIALRTKGAATRPIDAAYLGDEAEGKRNLFKYLNFGLPILLIVIYGFFRSQRQRNTRLKRMQESY